MNIIAVNEIDNKHLETVKNEMKQLGPPTIKAVWVECWDAWVALEGSHRINAAKSLGLIPQIEEIEYSDKELCEVGVDDVKDPFVTVEEFVDEAWKDADLQIEF